MTKELRILIVDDSEIERAILSNMLAPHFAVEEAENGFKALERLADKKARFDAVLLDVSMPVLDGIEVLRLAREGGCIAPVILITAEATKETVSRAAPHGIADFIVKPYTVETVYEKLGRLLDISPDGLLRGANPEAVTAEEEEALQRGIDALRQVWDRYLRCTQNTTGRYRRVSELSAIVLGEYAARHPELMLEQKRLRLLSQAVYFYEIGIMSLPDEAVERQYSQTASRAYPYSLHPVLGADIVRLNQAESCKKFVDCCAEICLTHHERYDGKGYPKGLKGEKIPYYAGICAALIRFDEIWHRRRQAVISYEALFNYVMAELLTDRGAFDPEVTEALSGCQKEILQYYRSAGAG